MLYFGEWSKNEIYHYKENELKTKQAELNDLLRSGAEFMIHMTKHKYYAEGFRMSLSESFKNHCKELYTSSSVPSENDFTNFFSGLGSHRCH